MEERLIFFYNTYMLPELVDSRQSRGMALRGSEN